MVKIPDPATARRMARPQGAGTHVRDRRRDAHQTGSVANHTEIDCTVGP